MRDFVFYAPTKIYFGKSHLENIGGIIQEYGFKKVAVHYGQGSVIKTKVLEKVVDFLSHKGFDPLLLGGVEPNPKLAFAKKTAAVCMEEGVDFILAIGGGSVIDSAKLVGAIIKNPGVDPWKFFTKEKTPQDSLPLGVILTIASAGSEMSSSCVITDEKTGLKRGFTSEHNRPLFSVLNPELTYTVPAYHTACGVVDSLMHTIERYFQPEREAELTHEISEAIMRNIITAGRVVMKNPTDYDARATIMWGSSLSHNGLTGAGKREFLQLHQLEHEVSGAYDEVAHGAGLSALFNAWAHYVYKSDIDKFYRYATKVWGCEESQNRESVALEGIKKTVEYFSAVLHMPVRIREFNLPDFEEKINDMSRKCSHNGKRVLPGVKELNEDDIKEIFYNSI